MQILSTQQIRDWDQYTIAHEPISSLALMERAATVCMEWLENNDYIFCGKGNNGGDGLALARLLWTRKANVEVSLLDLEGEGSKDFQFNLRLLGEQTII